MATTITSHFALIDPELIRDYIRFQPLNFLPVGSVEFQASGQISFEQTPEESESGLSYRQELSLSTLEGDLLGYDGRKMYVAFYMSDGSLRLIGTASCAPRLKVTPFTGALKLETSFDSASPLVL